MLWRVETEGGKIPEHNEVLLHVLGVADWWRKVERRLVQVQRSVPVLSVRGQMCVYLNQTLP